MYFDFEENSGGFLTKIGYKEQKVFNITQDVVEDVIENVVEKRWDKILTLLKQNSQLSAYEIAKLLKITERTIQRDFNKLKNRNKIKRIGSDKSGHWEVLS